MDIPTLPSKVPGYNLYIDGFQALRRPKILQGSNITHVVSVLDWKFQKDWASLRGFQHLHIPLDDVYDSNILSYFPRSNAFIHEGLKDSRSNQFDASGTPLKDGSIDPIPGGVLVHWALKPGFVHACLVLCCLASSVVLAEFTRSPSAATIVTKKRGSWSTSRKSTFCRAQTRLRRLYFLKLVCVVRWPEQTTRPPPNAKVCVWPAWPNLGFATLKHHSPNRQSRSGLDLYAQLTNKACERKLSFQTTTSFSSTSISSADQLESLEFSAVESRDNVFVPQGSLERGRGCNDCNKEAQCLQLELPGDIFHGMLLVAFNQPDTAMGVSRSATIVIAYLLWHSRQTANIVNQQSQTNPKTQDATNTSSSSTSSAPAPDMVSLPPTPLTVDSALALVREGRPQVEPNSGFIKQLRMYEAMGCPNTQEQLESHKIYRRWMNSRNVLDALSENRAPEMDHISFRDEEDDENSQEDGSQSSSSVAGNNDPLSDRVQSLTLLNPDNDEPTEILNPDITLSSPSPAPPLPANVEIKCRKCRRLLAKSSFILPHKPPPHRDPSAAVGGDPCAHIFLHPLSWMRPVLSQGQLDGRLTCPTQRCGANIGKFAWQGLRCSCGGWVTPGFGLAKGKVDEVRIREGSSSRGGEGGGSAPGQEPGPGNGGGKKAVFDSAVRFPPGMRRAGNGNL
ncbi:hypothetical protein AYO22_09336 [Fonsecaea multimorphosa]|nr:hypothetical protein AYO22_09336 [Fonsecaea multimorphosa]